MTCAVISARTIGALVDICKVRGSQLYVQLSKVWYLCLSYVWSSLAYLWNSRVRSIHLHRCIHNRCGDRDTFRYFDTGCRHIRPSLPREKLKEWSSWCVHCLDLTLSAGTHIWSNSFRSILQDSYNCSRSPNLYMFRCFHRDCFGSRQYLQRKHPCLEMFVYSCCNDVWSLTYYLNKCVHRIQVHSCNYSRLSNLYM